MGAFVEVTGLTDESDNNHIQDFRIGI